MTGSLYGLVLGVLATWRVTHLLQAEDGPGDVLVRFRRAVGDGFFGSLLDCFYCLSVWIAAPFALLVGTTWSERAMLWLAFSGGASLLERWGAHSVGGAETPPNPTGIPAVPHFVEDEEPAEPGPGPDDR